ncbi:CPBP family intramembrane metalloprotease [Bacillus sp. sid0103]|uniref:CPBP family intramembrane glutamic endopeptidase n=1 Tax=Bacillus sp. sid0103 TaxID=2856337 RepID=UPI001C46ADF2|nr:type II CAAX endopeptidase family protein [Bacillus sp. sid0103]MBV7506505.1 CPBP family intramembrane metalloprotease [Bacillus sp. sid0103]
MERTNQKGIWLAGYFIIMMFLFTRGFYTPFFVLLITFLLIIILLKEAERLFAWMIVSFFLGNLLVGYLDNFIESFHLSPFSLIMLSQLLWLVPILMMSYVIKQFKKELSPYFHLPLFTGEIQLPFRIVFSLKSFSLIVVLLAVIAMAGSLLLQKEGIQWRPFLLILLFATVNAFLEEVLWRGILLSKMISITSRPIGLIVSCFAFGINTTMFGFSLVICMMYVFLGLILGFVTIRTKVFFLRFLFIA